LPCTQRVLSRLRHDVPYYIHYMSIQSLRYECLLF
jgi:hypothetical protein